MIDSLCLARSYESRAVVVFANTAGKLKMRRFTDSTAGRSQVVAPFRNLICEMKGSDEGVIRCNVDTTALILARKYFG
jgi:predicted amidohydrolase